MSGAESSMGLNYRRRVIYQALHETFADAAVARAYFDLWQRDHSQEVHFVVTRFASAVAKAAGFDVQQKSQFQRKLFHGLTQPYETLPRVPEAWIANDAGRRSDDRAAAVGVSKPLAAPAAAPPAAIASHAPTARAPVAKTIPTTAAPTSPVLDVGSPERIVFAAFAQHLTAAILNKADRHLGILIQAVADLPVGSDPREQALFAQFQQWSEARFRSELLPPLRTGEDLRYFTHQLYLLVADLIGPMQADRLLAEATALSERLPEAAIFSPQTLL